MQIKNDPIALDTITIQFISLRDLKRQSLQKATQWLCGLLYHFLEIVNIQTFMVLTTKNPLRHET